MRIWQASLAGAAIVAVAVTAAVELAPAHVYAAFDRIRNPIARTREISWSRGSWQAPAGPRPPNIVLIVFDDLGINDLTSTGGGFANGAVPTPNIDAIAREGANFLLGHAGSATCSPSRAALMTGRYPARFGFEFTPIPVAVAKRVGRRVEGAAPPSVYHSELRI